MLNRTFSAPKAYLSCLKRRRLNSTLAPLPALEEWKTLFPFHAQSGRIFVKESSTADVIAHACLNDRPNDYPTEGKVVIEAFPGPGVLTRSFLSLPKSKIKKLIVLEDSPEFLEYLKPLEAFDPRVQVVPLSGFHWSTYRDIEARGILDDITKTNWEDPMQTNLHFVAHIPSNVFGDQLVAQFLRLIPERAWLFKYGRVPLSMILSEAQHQRMVAAAGSKTRSKVGVITEAVSEVKDALPRDQLAPFKNHFHPLPPNGGVARKVKGHVIGGPVVAVNLYPTKESAIQTGLLEKWDYVLRRMFVLKSTPLKKSLSALGPGAANLAAALSNPDLPVDQRVDCAKAPRELTAVEWALVVKAFDEWPFAPEDLSISDTLYKDIERD